MAFVPYMVGGYAVDKMMGGDGTKGALLGAGGSFLPGMLASGATTSALTPTLTAGELAGATGVAGTQGMSALNAPSILAGTGSNLTGSGMVTGMSNAGLMGATNVPTHLLGAESLALANANPGNFELMKRGLGSTIDGLTNNPITDFIGQGKDYIDTGYEDMTMMDKVQSGMMVDSAVNQPTPQLNIAPPPVDNRSQVPTAGKPLITQIQDIQTREPTEEELKYRAGLLR
jgi:hypothetical protein|tara:strand:+ start:195 stop:884 length:690 start_codon:yes stop_codon:yes gene_type:complete